MDCRTALQIILDSVDYTAGNCRPNEMVGAVLPKGIIAMARKAIVEFDKDITTGLAIADEVYKRYSVCTDPTHVPYVAQGKLCPNCGLPRSKTGE